MKRLRIFVLAIFVITMFSGCVPTSQTERTIDFVIGKPRVIETEPKNRAEEVDLNAEIKITFNKDIDEATLNNKNITITYLNEDLKFKINPFLGSEYDYENKVLTIRPSKEFLPNQSIEVGISSNVKSKEGKELSHSGKGGESDDIRYVFKFRTGKQLDSMNQNTQNNDVQYNKDSWKNIISDNCAKFSDGCNECSRGEREDREYISCTEMACDKYKKPECLE